MAPDDLEARRWLRELLHKLGEQYPERLFEKSLWLHEKASM
jgi:hypothetical protein